MKSIVSIVVLSAAFVSAGMIKDSRDNQTYKTVQIGNLEWMAQNLNFKDDEESWCYGKKVANCKKYGRLYTWDAAASSCPTGWRLPSAAEFDILWSASGSKDEAGAKLKSKSGWKSGNGEDAFGFAALPGGFWVDDEDSGFTQEGSSAYFWSGSEVNETTANYVSLDGGSSAAAWQEIDKYTGFSVRCVRNVQ